MKKIMLFAAACVALAACSKEIDTTTPEIGNGTAFEKGQTVTLTVKTGDQTKVSSELVTSGTDKDKVNFKWETGDKIKVTVGTESAEFTLKSGAGESTATFEGIMPEGGTKFSVQYPVTDVTDADLIEQTYVANGLPKDKMLMTATECTIDGGFALTPQYSALRLNLWGGMTVGKIVVIKTETTDPSFTLDCGTAGVTVGTTAETATPFFIVVPAGSYKFSAEVFDNAETPASIFYLETSSAVTFTAGQSPNMPAKEVTDLSKCLCFTCTSGNVAIGMRKQDYIDSKDPAKSVYAPEVNLQYFTSYKDGWQDFKLGDGKKGVPDSTSVALSPGDKVYFKAKTTNNALGANNAFNYFTTTTTDEGKVDVSGNIMSLLNGSNPATTMTESNNYAFVDLFKDCSSIQKASGLSLPATTLADYCYYCMFWHCEALTHVPKLPATTLANACYCSMFNKCTSLKEAPVLPATILEKACYMSMFNGCTGLTQAPALSATTLASSCYTSMFCNCTSLTEAPVLNVTELKSSCYSIMFMNCTSLNVAPALPATTLANSCYAQMFQGCTALTTAPDLNATTLIPNCYKLMFSGCSKLSSVTILATTDLTANLCLDRWLQNAGSDGSVTSRTVYVAEGMVDAIKGYCPSSPDWKTGVTKK